MKDKINTDYKEKGIAVELFIDGKFVNIEIYSLLKS